MPVWMILGVGVVLLVVGLVDYDYGGPGRWRPVVLVGIGTALAFVAGFAQW